MIRAETSTARARWAPMRVAVRLVRRQRQNRHCRLRPSAFQGDAAVTEPAIRIEALTKRFRNFTAVEALSFDVERGEIFGLLGPNGSGKTTTVNMISGLSSPTSGKVTVLGHDIVRDTRAVRRMVGAVPPGDRAI